MTAKAFFLDFGGPAIHDDWLQEVCGLPGVVAAHGYRPSAAQLPRTTTVLPEHLAIYELATNDLDGAAAALAAARGRRDGDHRYRSSFYNLISRTPGAAEATLTAGIAFLVWVRATRPAFAEELLRWYVDGHLDEICGLPGVVSGRLLRPGAVQLPDTPLDELPELLGFYEMETDDLAGAIDAAWAAHTAGLERDVYEPGRTIPTPVEVVSVDPRYESAYYDLITTRRPAR